MSGEGTVVLMPTNYGRTTRGRRATLWADDFKRERPRQHLTVLGALLAVLSGLLLSGCARPQLSRPPRPVSEAPGQKTEEDVRLERSAAVSRLHLVSRLRVGSSEKEVSEIMGESFLRAEADSFAQRHPFRELLPQLDPERVIEWKSPLLQEDG